MRMAKSIGWALVALAACHRGPIYHYDAQPIDAHGPDGRPAYWTPAPGDAKNWDVQLAAPFDLKPQRTMYMLDLWDVVPASMQLDYGDGDPVTVPAGSQAGAIAALHATTPGTYVFCRISTGALELSRPDARKFPGWKSGLTTCPPSTAPLGVIGAAITAPDECALDFSAAKVDTWSAIMAKRLDLAAAIGCDGVVGDRNDIAAYDTGFALGPNDELAWYEKIIDATHARLMSAGAKDGDEVPDFPDMLALDADWFVIQRCAELQTCDAARPFINQHKDVFAIDYQLNAGAGTGVDPAIGCPRQQNAQISDGLVKDEKLSSAYRVQCTP